MGVALVLFVVALRSFWTLLTVTNVIVDTTAREMRCQNRFAGRVHWRVPFDEVVYVLVSQTLARSLGRKGPDGPMRIAQEVWLHLYDGSQFRLIADLGQVEGHSQNWEAIHYQQRQRGRRRLKLADFDTLAHRAARWMANVLDTEVWLDIR